MSTWAETFEHLMQMVEHAERIAKRRGVCQMQYADQSACDRESVTWCGDCGSEVCGNHATICCTAIRCEPCHQIHLATYHEWLSRQAEFRGRA